VPRRRTGIPARVLVRRRKRRDDGEPAAVPKAPEMTRARVASLDVFRGASVAAMILVNNPGNWLMVFPQLQHASWNGCTIADLVFPSFILIMGAAFALTAARDHGTREADRQRVVATIRRALLLVGFGLLLNLIIAWPDLETFRIPGVLQRIGLTYLL